MPLLVVEDLPLVALPTGEDADHVEHGAHDVSGEVAHRPPQGLVALVGPARSGATPVRTLPGEVGLLLEPLLPVVHAPLQVERLHATGPVLVAQVDDETGVAAPVDDEPQIGVLIILLTGEVDLDTAGQGLRQGLGQFVPVVHRLDHDDLSFFSFAPACAGPGPRGGLEPPFIPPQ